MKFLLPTLAALALAAPAAATIRVLPTTFVAGQHVVSEGTFTEIYPGGPGFGPGAGVYGVELVGGRSGAAGREIYVGKNTGTGAPGRTESEITWGSNLRPFTLTWNSSGLSITISGTTYNAPAAPNNAPLTATGNTLKIFVKSSAELRITAIDGTPIANITEPGGGIFNGDIIGSNVQQVSALTEKHFYSSDNWGGNGLTVTGTLKILDGGGSARGIYIKQGNYTPPPAVPEPASWALLIAGFGLTGVAMRRRNRQPSLAAKLRIANRGH